MREVHWDTQQVELGGEVRRWRGEERAGRERAMGGGGGGGGKSSGGKEVTGEGVPGEGVPGEEVPGEGEEVHRGTRKGRGEVPEGGGESR